MIRFSSPIFFPLRVICDDSIHFFWSKSNNNNISKIDRIHHIVLSIDRSLNDYIRINDCKKYLYEQSYISNDMYLYCKYAAQLVHSATKIASNRWGNVDQDPRDVPRVWLRGWRTRNLAGRHLITDVVMISCTRRVCTNSVSYFNRGL